MLKIQTKSPKFIHKWKKNQIEINLLVNNGVSKILLYFLKRFSLILFYVMGHKKIIKSELSLYRTPLITDIFVTLFS